MITVQASHRAAAHQLLTVRLQLATRYVYSDIYSLLLRVLALTPPCPCATQPIH